MKLIAAFATLTLFTISLHAQEVDTSSVEINMKPFGERPSDKAVMLDSSAQEAAPGAEPSEEAPMDAELPAAEKKGKSRKDRKGYQDREVKEEVAAAAITYNYYDFLMMITGHYEAYMTEVHERDEDGEIVNTWAAVKLENMVFTGNRKEVDDGWKGYWKEIKKEADATIILKEGKVFIGFDLILNNVQFDVFWLEDLDIGNVTMENCSFEEGIHLVDVTIKEMEIRSETDDKEGDKKNAFMVRDSKIKKLRIADLDQFFKFRQEDSTIERLDIY